MKKQSAFEQATNSSAGAPASPGIAGEVNRLIAAGKCKQAVEMAKEAHKRQKTPESERVVVDAYLSRIDQFQKKGAIEDANILLKLVYDRFPAHRGRLSGLRIQAAAVGGNIAELVAPLIAPGLSDATRATIDDAIRCQLIDLPALASCPSLPADHPLKVAAAAAWKAFNAVTAGPVTDEQIALPEISRRSPLAGWKVLVRAIAAFYRGDDVEARRAVDAITEDAAVRHLASPLRLMMEGGRCPVGAAALLQARVGGSAAPLQESIKNFEMSVDVCNLNLLTRSTHAIMKACLAAYPQMIDRVRQHIFVRCISANAPYNAVLRAIGQPLKNAYFWKLFASSTESDGARASAAVYWDRFRRHAIAEGLFTANSIEAGIVHLYAADLLVSVSTQALEETRERMVAASFLDDYYRAQPEDVAALAPRSDDEIVDALDIDHLFRRATDLYPAANPFRKWYRWAEDDDAPDADLEGIATRWHLALPRDPEPLLLLSTLAEQRDALKLAMKHLTAAEAIDRLNPQVRKARVRLSLSTAWRHFRARKPHLVEADLSALGALPSMGEGDRAGLLLAMRSAWHVLRGEGDAAQRSFDLLVKQAGPLVADCIMNGAAGAARLDRNALPRPASPALLDPHAVADAEARLITFTIDLDVKTYRPLAWSAIICDVLRERPCPLSHAQLLAIGSGAVATGELQRGYLASAAGLATATGPAAARFLLMRARTLDGADGRIAQCLRAALELAHQTHDPELMGEISEEISEHPRTRRAISAGAGAGGLGEGMLAEVLKSERAASVFPRGPHEAEKHVVLLDRVPADGFTGRFDVDDDDDEDLDDDFDGDYEDDDDDDDDDELLSSGLLDTLGPLSDELATSAQPLLERLRKKFGHIPSIMEIVKDDPKALMEVIKLLGMAGPLPDGTDSASFPPPFGRKGKRRGK